ncbi:MAG: 50S ribosomal protein L17 [bacterium]|nr:50S ribosomal protein L17 [bacterium]
MRKKVFGRRLKRNKDQRKALFKSLMSALVLEERIKTTEQKAKSIKGQIEKLVTKVKTRGENAQNFLNKYLSSNALDKFVKDVTPRFSERNGGYTRIVRIGKRFDSSSMVFLEWTEEAEVQSSKEDKKTADTKAQNKIESKEINTPKKEKTKKGKEVKKRRKEIK